MTKQVELPEPASYLQTRYEGLGKWSNNFSFEKPKKTPLDNNETLIELFTSAQMKEYAEQRVREALKYASDMARMHELGTPEGHEIADAIDEYAQSQAKGESDLRDKK